MEPSISKTLAIIVAVVGIISLTGWFFDIAIFKSIIPGSVTIKANTALAFMLSGISLISFLLLRERSSGNKQNQYSKMTLIPLISASIVFIIGLLTIMEYVFSIEIGIDQLIFKEPAGAILTSNPGRMSFITAFNFILVGLSLFMLNFDKKMNDYIVQILSLLTALVSFIALTGYLYDYQPLYRFASFTAIALPTAFTFIIISTAVLLSNPVFQTALFFRKNYDIVLITISLITIILLASLSIQSIEILITSQQSKAQTAERIKKLGLLVSHLTDAETGVRGYVITGDADYLDSYNKAVTSGSVHVLYTDLKILLADSGQLEDLNTLEKIVNSKLAIMNKIINLRRDKGFEPAKMLVISGDGKEYMDDIREIAIHMIAKENRALAQENYYINIRSKNVEIIVISGFTAVALLILFSFHLLNREIGRRRLNEERLYESESLFRSLFEKSPLGKSMTSIDGRIKINQAFAGILGYSIEELSGKNWKEITHPDDIQYSADIVQSILNGEKSQVHYEKRYIHKNGNPVWADVNTAINYDKECKPLYFITTISDITERKEAEEKILSLNSELSAVNKELESFSYSVSHDLRSPIRGIDGWSQALEEDYGDKLGDEAKGWIKIIRSETKRMADLIDSLLTLARVSRSALRRETVDITELARKLSVELQKDEPGRNASFIIEPGMTAEGDNALLLSLLQNLLGNAWKFTSKQQQTEIEIGKNEENGKTVFFVRDNGSGFDMKFIDRLFTPFNRLHNSEEYPGTGIGLATVQRIINKHGGTIRAWGEPGKGAIFYFSF